MNFYHYHEKINEDDESLNIILKDLIEFDEYRVRSLRKEIINKCSRIVSKKERLCDSQIYYLNRQENIRNLLKIKNDGKQKYLDSSVVDYYYLCSYDELIFPPIVSIIDRLLKSDDTVLEEIFNPKIEVDESLIIKAEKMAEEIDKINNFDVEAKIKRLNELKSVLDKQKSFNYKNNDYVYYKKLQDLIKVSTVEFIYSEKLNEALLTLGFFEDSEFLEKYQKDHYEFFNKIKIKRDNINNLQNPNSKKKTKRINSVNVEKYYPTIFDDNNDNFNKKY